jgi:drug/metabolite transporter superfamily protein YnfA
MLLSLVPLTAQRPAAAAIAPPAGLSVHDWQGIQARIPEQSQPLSAPQDYLKASNAQGADIFGYSVAIDGDTMVVGAPLEDSNGSSPADNSAESAGAAYVFVRTNGIWIQQAYLKASNAETKDYFGASVAIAGDTVIIGASGEAGNGSSPADNSAAFAGAAYVFVRSGAVWTQQAYLKAANAEESDRFGSSVAISGDAVAGGAWGEDSNGSSPADNSTEYAGATYVFVRNGAVWSQQDYLKAEDPQFGAFFGSAVAISGDTVVVGAAWEDNPGINPPDNDAGAVHVFVRGGTKTWSLQAHLVIANSWYYTYFGTAVAGDTLVIGAPGEGGTSSPAYQAGAAYVFVRSGTVWHKQTFLQASAPEEYNYFGSSVAISGDTVAVGAPYHWSVPWPFDGVNDAGIAYVFDHYESGWRWRATLTAANAEEYDSFGDAIAISGDTVVVGATSEDSDGSSPANNTALDAGAAYAIAIPPAPTYLPTYLPFLLYP